MFARKYINIAISVLMIASLFLGANTKASAQGVYTPPTPDNPTPITPADRQAAADRMAAQGFRLPQLGEAQMVTSESAAPRSTMAGPMSAQAMGAAATTSAPHYFSVPNYANSPLRLPDAIVTFTGDGTGAAATATVDPTTGTITALMLDNGGSGYSTVPSVSISSAVVTTGTGASATAAITGTVSALALTNGGSGYTTPVSVQLTGGGGTGATATVSITPTKFVSGITVTNGGTGYTAAAVTISGDGAGATAAANLVGPVSAITVDAGGSGYTSPTVNISGDGTGATASATVTPVGFVSGATITNGGSGYTAAAVAISGDGIGATADAAVDPGTGSVTGITITNGGSGYTTATIAISGDGTGATADAVLDTTSGPITSIAVTNGGSGYTNATVTISDPAGTGAAATATVTTDSVGSITVTNGGSGYNTATVSITGDGSGAMATAVIDSASGSLSSLVLTNPGSGYTSAPTVSFSSPTGLDASATATISGSVTSLTLVSGGSGYVLPGIRKFMDTLPGLGPAGANNLGQYIPVAVADTTTYPGSDYYEIAVVQYQEQMHSDLPPTTLRGYVQLSTSVVPGAHVPLFNPDGSPILLPDGTQAYAVDNPHYLGPLIEATKDKPVRVLFRNLLPTGTGGDLFLPVDTTEMGAGMGPNMGGMPEPDPQHPMCNMDPKPAGCYTENRATLHLHGGITPWISDGTPHQWTTPAGESTQYPQGVSVSNVPDMPDPGPGALTFFYTNQQSARLMFYHDHAYGITRLNVYAGMAAGYLITDSVEQNLINQGLIPTDQIPLVIEDKTFVPDTAQLALEDPTWDIAKWGGLGSLWFPHVYMPNQNPGDSSGVNAFGRWDYGPWFWPATTNITYGPMANPYYDPNCDPNVTWCEPPQMPATPYLSMTMEAFNDTPTVNGTAYPTVTVDPKSYRFRILNAANDRFWNLSLYRADASGTEVALNPTLVAQAQTDPTVFPTPVVGTEGPSWIQIGTEGGFLPSPAVILPHPITWVTDMKAFNFGNVDQHALLLGPAERADVIVDFSAYAGQTLILYNDAPAAFPARDPRQDYYTGAPDMTTTGGAPSPIPGYGPNTRTVMQIKVNAAPVAPAFDLAALQAAFAHQPDGSGVFESGQNPIIVGQGAYNSAYGTSFQSTGPYAGLVNINDTQLTFDTLSGNRLTMPLQRKAIHDEMGGSFDAVYGRMSGQLGVEADTVVNGAQLTVLYHYIDPPTEVLDGVELPPGVSVTPIATTTDGTQIWKFTHNGVDTHPIHFHLYDVQLINRVGWDGQVRKPDANELGWKDTVRISPLEDTIIAIRPIIPKLPFGVPDSWRPLDPSMPLGSTVEFTNLDTQGNAISPPVSNQIVNFGWEYVFHCHILSHEEMDMMRPVQVNVATTLPTAPVLSIVGSPGGPIDLSWTDGTPVTTDIATWGDPANEIGFRVERAIIAGAFTPIATTLANATNFTDTTTVAGTQYQYRVVAFNTAGDSPSNVVATGTILRKAPPPDFNGNGATDIAVYRPSDNTWYPMGQPSTVWGAAGDILVPEDYNGDGKSEVATFRPSDGSWNIAGMPTVFWGINGDIPMPGDYNGDGKAEVAVFRPSENIWYIQGMPLTMWGIAGDIPVPADYNGDGKTEIAVFRPSENMWYVQGMPFTMWGITGDVLVPGDYNGDGAAEVAVYRPSENMWYVQGMPFMMWGIAGDTLVPGDYNGDGTTDIAVFRPSEGMWYAQGQAPVMWGISTDIPLSKKP